MNDKNFVIATAGHVDHGKSAVVKALTGTDPDRLPEEKARAITIDLGFAHLVLPNHSDFAAEPLSASVIDVPGHEDFVRNMIAGLGSIDVALLVVAADDGWMPQTEEHLQILLYLGVRRLVVAVNKSDVADPRGAVAQIHDELRGTPYLGAPVVPISARSGDGMDRLKAAIESTLRSIDPPREVGKGRLLIDRAFNLPGVGPVITGTLTGGAINARQAVYLQPGNFKTRIRSLQTHRSNLECALPGMRTGVNLAETPKHSAIGDLRRGWVLTTSEFEATKTLDVRLEKSSRPAPPQPAAMPLKSFTGVYLHHGTGRVPAVIVLADDEPLHRGQSTIAQLRLSSPVIAFLGDRFVIRDRSERYTIAGGIVLDPSGDPKSFRTAAQQQLLGARAADPFNTKAAVESELIRRGPMPIHSLLRTSNFSETEIRAALTELQRSGRVSLRNDIAADAESWQKLRQRVVDAIERVHLTRSEQPGLELTEVRAALNDRPVEITNALIEDLCADGFARRGSVIAKTSHQPQLPAVLLPGASRILATLNEKPLHPPARRVLAPTPAEQQVLRYLIEQKQVVELGQDIIVAAGSFSQAKEIVRRVISTTGPATVSELRAALQTSRRVAVPLLERLDRERITRRIGERRVLVEPQLSSPPPVQS